MKEIDLYRNAVSVRRALCSKKGYVEYIQKETELFGKSSCYALFTHSGVLVGTCGYEAGIDRFREFSEMRDFLLNERIKFNETTGIITECLEGWKTAPDKSLGYIIKTCEKMSKEGNKRDCKETASIDKNER